MGSSWCMDWVAATTCIQCFAGALRPSPEPKRTSTCWNGLLLTCFKRLPCCRRLLRIDLSETIPLLETPCTSTVAPDQRDNLRGRRLIPRSGLVHSLEGVSEPAVYERAKANRVGLPGILLSNFAASGSLYFATVYFRFPVARLFPCWITIRTSYSPGFPPLSSNIGTAPDSSACGTTDDCSEITLPSRQTCAFREATAVSFELGYTTKKISARAVDPRAGVR